MPTCVVLLCALAQAGAPLGTAEPLRVAVAANFAATADALGQAFTAAHGRPVVVVSGATGLLYAHIVNAAPFHVFLAADTARPAALERSGNAVPGSRYVFAMGRLALWSRTGAVRDSSPLFAGGTTRLAIAKPETAPYGAAAKQALERLGVWPGIASRIVRGENVSQAYQFAWSGSVSHALVARAALQGADASSYWVVPSTLHDPILQEAILLRYGEADADAHAFLAFLRTPEARAIIRTHGYDVPQ